MEQNNQYETILILTTIIIVFISILIFIHFVTKNLKQKKDIEDEKNNIKKKKYIEIRISNFLKEIASFIEETINEVEQFDRFDETKQSLAEIKRNAKLRIHEMRFSIDFQEISHMIDLTSIDKLLFEIEKTPATNWKKHFEKIKEELKFYGISFR